MKAWREHAAVGLMAVALVLAGCAAAPRAEAPPVDLSEEAIAARSARPLNRIQMHYLVMAIADGYLTALQQETMLLESRIETPDERLQTLGLLYAVTVNMIDIAVDPNPAMGLLNLLALVHLQRLVFEDYWHPKYYGEKGDEMMDTLRYLEDEAFAVARRVMSAEQQEDLLHIVDSWYEEQGELRLVAGYRFLKLLDAPGILESAEDQQARGLLAEIAVASESVDEARLLGERMMWYASRLPRILGLQTEYTLYKIAREPEIRKLMSFQETFSKAVHQLAVNFSAMRDQLPQERAALLEQLGQEREAAIRQILEGLAAEREALLGDIEGAEDSLRPVLADTRQTIEAGQALTLALNELAGRFERAEVDAAGPGPGPEARPSLEDMRAAMGEMNRTMLSATTLVQELHGLVEAPSVVEGAKGLDDVVGDVRSSGDHWLGVALRNGVILVLVFFAVLFAYRLACRRWLPGTGG